MKIYVGNLGFNTTEDEVRDLLEGYGTITSVAWMTDRDTGRFRGFAFVEMGDPEGAAAISALDGQDFQGRALRVNEARPREERGGGGQPRGGGGQNRGGRQTEGGTSDRRW
jgi:RNA recognition motif-containing protein